MPEQLATRLLTEWAEAFDALKAYVNDRGDLAQVTGRMGRCAGTATWISSGQARQQLRGWWPT